MAETDRLLISGESSRSGRKLGLAAILAGAISLPLINGEAQVPEAGAYPVDPVAAAGMTSGLPNGITSRQAQMMQVRTSAQGAMGEAAAASMARSADETIEERNRASALQTARTNKAIKEEMRNRLRFESVSAQQEKVSAHDMSTWQQNGGVRVERNVPDAFISSLIAEEEQAAARAAASGQKKRFSLFGGDDSDDGGGILSSIRPPRLPFMGGGGGGSAPETSAPPPSDNSEPVFAQGGSSRSAPAPAPAPVAAKPGVVPMISGAALVDGRSPVGSGEGSASAPPASSRTVSFADSPPDHERKKSSLFSRSTSGESEGSFMPSSSSGSSGGGFFGFGKKKAAEPTVGIDAGLFPEGAVDQAPRGGRLTGSATVEDVSRETTFASDSTGTVELPGQTMEKSRGFSLPKPSLSLPSLPSVSKSGGGGGGTTGAGYHVVTSTAQFMVYGSEQMQSEIRALPAGTSVLVTKPGEQWSGIRLDDGTEGVVQNKHLKAMSQ
ncbi:MAG: hypothetical protein KDN18_16740 [Verrucomicrobiae bacterium]|nr:hypothetical protein [Verrucomicrobiae bacterium]